MFYRLILYSIFILIAFYIGDLFQGFESIKELINEDNHSRTLNIKKTFESMNSKHNDKFLNQDFSYLSFEKNWYTVDLIFSKGDLYSNNFGLKQNPQGRGKKWERKAQLNVFLEDNIIFSNHIGARLHGGAHRHRSVSSPKSFRIYARKKFGSDFFPSIFLDDKNSDIKYKKLVLRLPSSSAFINEISFDFTNLIGGMAPKTNPIRFYLNKEFKGIYFFTEFLEKSLIEKKLNHKNIIFYKYKGRTDPISQIEFNKLELISKRSAKLTLEEFKKHINIENFSAHLFSIIFLNCSDWVQGVIYKDPIDQKWNFINWDMDRAFSHMDRYKKKFNQIPHLIHGLDFILKPYKQDLRSDFFLKLLKDDPKAKQYFYQRFKDLALSIDESFINKLLEKYYNLSKNNESLISDINKHKNFLIERKPIFLGEIEAKLNN